MRNCVTLGLALIAAQPLLSGTVQPISALPPFAEPQVFTTDSAGNIYVAGTVNNPYALETSVFAAKISPGLDPSLIYYAESPYAAPSFNYVVWVGSIAVGPDGSLYLSVTTSDLFGFGASSLLTRLGPQGGAFQTATALLPGGAVWAPSSLAVDASGNVYATGFTENFPSTPGSLALPPTSKYGSNFIAKLDPTLSTVIYAISGYGGSAIAVDSRENVYTVGAGSVITTSGAFQASVTPANCVYSQPCPDQYVTAIDSTGTRLRYQTYLSGSTGGEYPSAIAVDSNGNVYVAGSTGSTRYPTTAGSIDTQFRAQPIPYLAGGALTGYVTALNAAGSALLFSTFFGGSATDTISSMALDQVSRSIYLAGYAYSPDLPGLSAVYKPCVPQAYVAQIAMDGSSISDAQTVYPLGSGPALGPGALGLGGDLILEAGGLLAEFSQDDASPSVACLANSANLLSATTLTPGNLITIFGEGLASSASASAPVNGVYPDTAVGVSVTFDGAPAPILYASPNQLNVQVPFEMSGRASVKMTINRTAIDNGYSIPLNLPVAESAITAFTVAVAPGECANYYPGQTKTLALNADGSVNSCANPAAAGSAVTIFLNGFGASPSTATGTVVSSSVPLDLSSLASVGAPLFSLATQVADPPPLPKLISAGSLAGSISGVYEMKIQVFSSYPYVIGNSPGVFAVQVAP